MTEARVRLLVQTSARLAMEHEDAAYWSAELSRETDLGDELVATAHGRSFTCNRGKDMVEAYDDISDEYASMAMAVQESGLIMHGLADPLLIMDLVVAPQWRGYNIGPHLLRWMATSVPGIGSIFLVPVPLPTRLDETGRWVSDWDMPRAGSGAKRKVRRAYRTGGFTHVRSGTWGTALSDHDDEMARIESVMEVLEL